MKRLLKYALPYWKLMLLSLVLLVFITGLELLNPYLLKVAIDDHINSNHKPLYEVNQDYPLEGVVINNNKYVREASLDDQQKLDLDQEDKKKILVDGNNYYLVDYEDAEEVSAISLSKDEYLSFRQSDIKGINKISFYFLLTIFFTFLFNYIQIFMLNYTGQKIIFNIRDELFKHIQSLSISYFDNNSIGSLVTRVTNDTETLNEMYTSVLVNLFKDLFTLLGIIFVMMRMNLRLSLLSFALIPFILIVSIIFRRKIRVVYNLSRIQLAKINSSLNENITGMRIIHIFKKERKISKEFDNINSSYLDTSLREVKIYAMLRPSIEIIRSLGIAALIYFGGARVLFNTMEFGMLYIFIDYLQRFFNPILDLTEKYNILQSSMASSERIFKLLDEKNYIENIEEPEDLNNLQGRIEFKNVWFAYQDEDWVLRDISFVINPGETVALVGATGAGKSSIINLITRFYDIQKGQILLDGVDIRNIDKYLLRKKIGVVLQDVFLFTGSIKDNIRLNNLNIDEEKIKEVARHVNADHFIEKLPNKYDQLLMERGSSLSSGERQLLSFARTLLYDPKILILDEATSNIDTETELLIQDALNKLTDNRTSIVIAHRLSTIQHADNIIVLRKGVIEEMGNHQELLNLYGIYYNLYQLQYS